MILPSVGKGLLKETMMVELFFTSIFVMTGGAGSKEGKTKEIDSKGYQWKDGESTWNVSQKPITFEYFNGINFRGD